MTLRIGSINVLICFTLLVVFITMTKISDYDFWWHLKLGESVYNSGQIYSADDFSYTFNGKHQFSAEWLADLIIYLSYRAGGLSGATILKTSIIFLTFLCLFMTLKNMSKDEDTGFYASIITLIVVLFSIRFRLFIRPYLFSFLFFSIFLYLISLYDKKRTIKILYLLPLLETAWANMSIGAVFGPILLIFFLIGDTVKNKINLRLLIILATVITFSLLNPDTYRLYTLLFSALISPYKEIIGEHQPVSLQILWGYGFKYTFAYQMLVIGSLVYFILMKGWKNIYHLLLFVSFFALSLMQVRMIDFFSLVSVIFLIAPLEKGLKILPSRFLSRNVLIDVVISLLILSIIPLSIAGSRTYSFGIGVKEHIFPEEAIIFLEKNNINGRLFNSYSFGGYIIWRSPEKKVFIDGRSRHLYSPEFYNAYSGSLKNADVWKSAEQQWGFDYAILEYDLKSRRFPMHLNTNTKWALVYWDNHSAVYLKRTEKNLRVTEANEYKIIKPNFNDFSYLEAYIHSKTPLNIIEQINREIAFNPSNQEPRLAKIFLLYNMGKAYYAEALKELEVTLKLKPDLAMEHSAIAFLMLEKGLVNEAKEEVRKAIRIDPDDMGAKYLLKELKM